MDALRRLLLLASLGAFLAGLEGRVVFYSLGQYIHLAPPWNYLAATLVLYGLAALVLLHFSGALGQETESESIFQLPLPFKPSGGLQPHLSGALGQEAESACSQVLVMSCEGVSFGGVSLGLLLYLNVLHLGWCCPKVQGASRGQSLGPCIRDSISWDLPIWPCVDGQTGELHIA